MKDLNTHDIKVLNELITTTLDSADGYSEAAKDAANPTFKNLFSQWAQERRQVVNELQGQVRILGGQPETDGSVLGSAHRVFLNIRDSLSKGDKGVVEEVERGEDYIKAKYEEALDDEDLSDLVRPVLGRAYDSVLQGHDQARNLKHRFEHS
ncbi:MAG: PA2169 family four-helix-bundle protein [Candidatus Obscuribacterales bacterium]|nr:PA2169 family four-helix-bundle protein [Steroidobacteraceae bacterium]